MLMQRDCHSVMKVDNPKILVNLLRIFGIQHTSAMQLASALYSVSVDLLENEVCLFDCQDIELSPMNTT